MTTWHTQRYTSWLCTSLVHFQATHHPLTASVHFFVASCARRAGGQAWGFQASTLPLLLPHARSVVA